jgi:hypothetical protein
VEPHDDRTHEYRHCPFLHEQLDQASPDLMRDLLLRTAPPVVLDLVPWTRRPNEATPVAALAVPERRFHDQVQSASH